MKYYKIISDNNFIGAVTSYNFFIENNNKLIASNDILGQYVEYNNALYRDYWMAPIYNSSYSFIQSYISQITEEEYIAFIQAQENNEPIEIDDDEPSEPEPTVTPIPEEPDLMLEYIRKAKFQEMSNICHITIENGFDLAMSDGEIHHFSLTTQDQLNLMTLSILAETEDTIPYHADGEESRFYTAAEIKLIINTANTFKNYQLAYYNSLKSYINALETIEKIAAITYGTPIPEEYKSNVLKVLE